MRVWRLADGAPVGEPLTGHDGWVRAVAVGGAAGRHPGHRQRRPRRHGAGVAAGRRHPGRGAAARPRRPGDGGGGGGAAGRHPGHRQRRPRRHGAGVAAGRRHPGRGAADAATPAGCARWRSGRCRTAPRSSSAAAATARCGCGGWPTAPRSGSRCAATAAGCGAVAVGALPDGTPVIVSGGDDGTVRVWRLADGTPVVPPLDLPESVQGCRRSRQRHRHCGWDRHRRPPASAPAAHALAAVLFLGTTTGRRNDRIMAGYPVHQRGRPGQRSRCRRPAAVARLGHVIRYIG